MPDPYPLEPHKRGGWLGILGWVLLLFLLTLGATVGVSWSLQRWAEQKFQQQADAIAENFRKAFNFTPEVRAHSAVLVAQSSPVLELVTYQRNAIVQHGWEQTWMGSTKNFEIEATFTAKAGFDLRERFVVKLDQRDGTIKTEMPKPKILSVGMSDVRIKRDENGLWNKLTGAEREQAFKELEKRAREDFEKSSVLSQAQAEAEIRIRELLQASPTPTPLP
jgi:hypothetical protein